MIDDDPEKRELLRDVADDIRAEESSEAEYVAAIVHRVSDLYDPDEDTSAQDIYLNVRYILQVKEQGGLDR